jgi:hypothetical protein
MIQSPIREYSSAAEMLDIQRRLGKYAKPEPARRPRPMLVYVRPDASHHVKAWEWWNQLYSPCVHPKDFIHLSCLLAGVEYDRLMSNGCKRELASFRRDLIRKAAAKWPRLSSPKIGLLFNRDHTTILYALGKTMSANGGGLDDRPDKPAADQRSARFVKVAAGLSHVAGMGVQDHAPGR